MAKTGPITKWWINYKQYGIDYWFEKNVPTKYVIKMLLQKGCRITIDNNYICFEHYKIRSYRCENNEMVLRVIDNINKELYG